jgi:hypothetical protein
MRLSTVSIALIAVLASLQALLSVFPFTITVGVSGQITLGVIGGPLIGILLGPVIGGLSALIGSLVGAFLNPAGAIFGILSVIPPFFGAVGAGLVKIKKGYVAGAIILASLLIFYANPFGREAFIYPWLHVVAMIVAFSPISSLAGSTFRSTEPIRPVFGILIASFVGVLTDHIVGSAIGIWYFSLRPEIWYFILPIYPIERVVALVLTTIVATPIYTSLKRAKLIDLLNNMSRTRDKT